jgi:RNA polymerase sigma-70 factor (ECF subfamily)
MNHSPQRRQRPDFDTLLHAAAGGDRRAFATLYETAWTRIFDTVRRVVIDPSQSEEVTQEVFLETWRKAPRFDPNRGTAAGWMSALARRRAIDRVRTSQADRDRDDRVAHRDLDVPYDIVGETAEIRIEHARAAVLLAELGPQYRAVVELVVRDGPTHREASAELDIPIGTVKSRLHTALKQLRLASRP